MSSTIKFPSEHPDKCSKEDFSWRSYICARLNVPHKYTNNKNGIRIHSEKLLSICRDLNNYLEDLRTSQTKQMPTIKFIKGDETFRFVLWGVYSQNLDKDVTFYPPASEQKGGFIYPNSGDYNAITFKIYLELYDIKDKLGIYRLPTDIDHSMYHQVLRVAQTVYTYSPYHPGIDLHGKMTITPPFYHGDPDLNSYYYTIQSVKFLDISNPGVYINFDE